MISAFAAPTDGRLPGSSGAIAKPRMPTAAPAASAPSAEYGAARDGAPRVTAMMAA
jgi:hypothetical protein